MGHIKAKKARKRLAARIADWDRINADRGMLTENIKQVSKPCGAILTFTKPGTYRR
jgi:hypothetical protein